MTELVVMVRHGVRLMFRRRQQALRLRWLFALGALFWSLLARAELVDDVQVKELVDGYRIEVQFSLPVRYLAHTPPKEGRTLEVQLRPENLADPDLDAALGRRQVLNWDASVAAPLSEITFDTALPDQPSLFFRFKQKVRFQIASSSDLRTIVVTLTRVRSESGAAAAAVPENLITELKKTDAKMADLIDRANNAMLDKKYYLAVRLLTKIRDEGNEQIRPRAQEMLGVAREYNGQFAHAKAEYEQYLKDYPESDGSKRVAQRLRALLTDNEISRSSLSQRQVEPTSDAPGWKTQFYGSFAQFYYRDETKPEDQSSQLIRSELVSDLDLIARATQGDYDVKGQFVGSYQNDLRSDGDSSEFLPSIMSLEARDSSAGVYGRLGRQSRTSGGVLGRFDGLHAAYDLSSIFTLNGVVGYPVDFSQRTRVNTDQSFYGVSLDIGTLWQGWDFNTFYINQENSGVTDREAIGGETRYFDSKHSLFSLLDYDVAYNELNIFLVIANWNWSPDTSFNVVWDQRNSPILTTTNAIQGQGVEALKDMFDLYNEDELMQLAQDRTADSRSFTAGVTHQLTQWWQVIGEVTLTEIGETPASGGVEAIPGTGQEAYYSLQWVANHFVYDSDIMILGLRYADTFSADTLSFNGNWRINSTRDLRLNPRLRIDYRDEKEGNDKRWLVRPSFRTDYHWKKWMKFEGDLGYEWIDESFSGVSQTTTGYYMSLGYRLQF